MYQNCQCWHPIYDFKNFLYHLGVSSGGDDFDINTPCEIFWRNQRKLETLLNELVWDLDIKSEMSFAEDTYILINSKKLTPFDLIQAFLAEKKDDAQFWESYLSSKSRKEYENAFLIYEKIKKSIARLEIYIQELTDKKQNKNGNTSLPFSEIVGIGQYLHAILNSDAKKFSKFNYLSRAYVIRLVIGNMRLELFELTTIILAGIATCFASCCRGHALRSIEAQKRNVPLKDLPFNGTDTFKLIGKQFKNAQEIRAFIKKFMNDYPFWKFKW
jgi:hypothetical protein